MNVYDFDKTVFDGDSTAKFYRFCLCRRPSLIFRFPLPAALRYLIKRDAASKLAFKERFYRFLQKTDDIDGTVNEFWRGRALKGWYLEQKRADDVIISASPEFLLAPVCKKLGVTLLASRVDKRTGKYDGLNCHGEEKVRRFRERYGDAKIDEFYSDSRSDAPLARLAARAYLVKGDKRIKWN